MNNRKSYLSDKKAQFTIIILLGGLAIICASAIAYVVYSKIGRMIEYVGTFPSAPTEMTQGLATMHRELLVQLGVIIVVMVIYFIIAGIYLTHRVIGPIWKLTNELEKFFAGEKINSVTFRDTDEFQALPKLINKLIQGYKEK